ncbi:1-acyl-sn-glycerol-3-phosphate acyltransferase [Arthrobacter oryzae]|uniref:1-acyl-sn-glycerol-3-phosphate acyltransferase n=1 Tax=Arthrobacter oryzae TaxID=409290 RepID=UPI0030C9FDBE
MPWRPQPNDRFYRFIVRTGLALRRLFGIRVIVTGREHLPPPGPLNGPSRKVVPGQGAVVAITHFGYVDFAFAELALWWNNRAEMRYLVTQGAADHWFAGPAISAAGHVVVPYGSGSGAYDAAVAKLREGEIIAVLPEAGVSRSFTVRDCKTGAVRMAAEAGVPLIPVSVWGAHRLLTRHHGFSPRRAWRAPVRIHVGRPLLPRTCPAPPRTPSLPPNSSGGSCRPGLTPPSRTSRSHPGPGPGGCRRTWAAAPPRTRNAGGWTGPKDHAARAAGNVKHAGPQ